MLLIIHKGHFVVKTDIKTGIKETCDTKYLIRCKYKNRGEDYWNKDFL